MEYRLREAGDKLDSECVVWGNLVMKLHIGSNLGTVKEVAFPSGLSFCQN